MSRKKTISTKDLKLILKIVLLPFTLIILIIKLINKNIEKRKQKCNYKNDLQVKQVNDKNEIYSKRNMITECEIEFLKKLQNIFKNDNYIIQPQIPLRMIIDKKEGFKGQYASELNRYIDYGIFDENYNIMALIELNDQTHKTKERHERDLKVKNICEQANIPLITFWTYGKQTDNDIKYIINARIEEARKKQG